MREFIYGFVSASLIFGFCLIVYVFYMPSEEALKEVKVTQVSGEKIEHSGFNYKDGKIKFTTKAEGKGEIITEIPKTNIPEARYWIENNNAVMLELLMTKEDRIYGASYMRRWGNFSAGGGVLVSGKRFEGVKLQTEYWFSL